MIKMNRQKYQGRNPWLKAQGKGWVNAIKTQQNFFKAEDGQMVKQLLESQKAAQKAYISWKGKYYREVTVVSVGEILHNETDVKGVFLL